MSNSTFNYPFLKKEIWRSDFHFCRPRCRAELLHEALVNIVKHKAVFIEPTFEFGTEDEIMSCYAELSSQLIRFYGKCPSGINLTNSFIHGEEVVSKASIGTKTELRENYYHTDEASKCQPSGLLLMSTIRPSQTGGQNVFVSVEAVIDKLRVTHPQLFDFLTSSSVFYVGDDNPQKLLEATSKGYKINWNFKKISKHNTDYVLRCVRDVHCFFEENDWSFLEGSASSTPGSATLWWDNVLLHRRVNEGGIKPTRKNYLWRMNTGREPICYPVGNKVDSATEPEATIATTANRLADDIQLKLRKTSKMVVVGIDGPNAAGKTTITKELRSVLENRSIFAVTISIDSFHFPTTTRYIYPGPIAFREFYFDHESLVDNLLAPIRKAKGVIKVQALEIVTEKKILVAEIDPNHHSVILLEGVFLQDSLLKEYLDLSVYIHVPSTKMLADGLMRWAHKHGYTTTLERFEERYLLAQREYISNQLPQYNADVLLERVGTKYIRREPADLKFDWPL